MAAARVRYHAAGAIVNPVGQGLAMAVPAAGQGVAFGPNSTFGSPEYHAFSIFM